MRKTRDKKRMRKGTKINPPMMNTKNTGKKEQRKEKYRKIKKRSTKGERIKTFLEHSKNYMLIGCSKPARLEANTLRYDLPTCRDRQNTVEKRAADLGDLMRLWMRNEKKVVEKKKAAPKLHCRIPLRHNTFVPSWLENENIIPFQDMQQNLHVRSAFAQLHYQTAVCVSV